MELSTKLPADAAAGSAAQLVVGSLDINQGAVLPAEELVGRQPQVWHSSILYFKCCFRCVHHVGLHYVSQGAVLPAERSS